MTSNLDIYNELKSVGHYLDVYHFNLEDVNKLFNESFDDKQKKKEEIFNYVLVSTVGIALILIIIILVRVLKKCKSFDT
jgi:hypothetical protein